MFWQCWDNTKNKLLNNHDSNFVIYVIDDDDDDNEDNGVGESDDGD